MPIAAVGLAVQIEMLWLLYLEVQSHQACLPPTLPTLRYPQPILVKTLVVTSLLLIAFGAGLPLLAESAFLAAATLLVTRRIKPQRVLQQVDCPLLIVFCSLFVFTSCVQSFNLLAHITPQLTYPLRLLLGITAVLEEQQQLAPSRLAWF